MQKDNITKLSSGAITTIKNNRISVELLKVSKMFKMPFISEELAENILHLFYTTDDNSDQAIADKLGLKHRIVCKVIWHHLEIKRDELNNRINNQS